MVDKSVLSEKKPKPSRGRPRDEGKNIAITEAASELFMELGFQGTNMDKIAKRAGVSKQTVYSHFESKEVLFARAISMVIERHSPANVLENLETHSLESDLRIICDSYARLLISPEAMSMERLLADEAVKGPELAQIFWESGPKIMQEGIKDFLRSWADKGELKIDNYNKAAALLTTLLKGKLQFKWSIGLISEVTEQMIQENIDDTVGVLLGLYKVK